MNSVKFSGKGSSDIRIFSIKSFFKWIFSLPQGFGLSFVCFDIGGEVVKFFLNEGGVTYTVESRFLRDMEVINKCVSYNLTI